MSNKILCINLGYYYLYFTILYHMVYTILQVFAFSKVFTLPLTFSGLSLSHLPLYIPLCFYHHLNSPALKCRCFVVSRFSMQEKCWKYLTYPLDTPTVAACTSKGQWQCYTNAQHDFLSCHQDAISVSQGKQTSLRPEQAFLSSSYTCTSISFHHLDWCIEWDPTRSWCHRSLCLNWNEPWLVLLLCPLKEK